MKRAALVTLAVGAALLGGCASGGLSGIGGTSTYRCQAPPGVSCMSVTGIDANADKRNLPGMRIEPGAEAAEDQGAAPSKGTTPAAVPYDPSAPVHRAKVSPQAMDAPFSGQPLRTPPRVLRIWMAPVEDELGGLHDQRYMYVTVDPGRWLLEANQARLRPQFKRVYPLGRREGSDETATPRPAGTQALPPPEEPAFSVEGAMSATTPSDPPSTPTTRP